MASENSFFKSLPGGDLQPPSPQPQDKLRPEDAPRLAGAALEAAANGIFITDRNGVIQWVNPAFSAMSGYTTAEALGQRPSLVKSNLHDVEFYRKLWKTVTSGRVWRGEITNRRKDGQLYISEQTIAPVRNADNQITHFVCVQQDITERKMAEKELRWKTAFLEANVDCSLDGILVVDAAGQKILQNQRMIDLWKIPEPISNQPDANEQLRFISTQTKDPATFAEKVAYLQAHPDQVSRDEIELRDNTILERYSSPVRDKAGTNYGRIWTFRDITERRELELQLRQSQKMESIGQLAGGVAHDFNNILAAILMETDLALLATPLPDDLRRGLGQIQLAATKAASLTRQLLLFSRREVMQPKALELNKVVSSLSQMLERILGEDVRLQLHLHSAPLMTRADAGMLDQLLLNLAVNARDAMPEGGTLLIQTGVESIEEAEARLIPDATPGLFVTLSVGDTGRGIAPDIMPRIFEPFFTTKEFGKGTGLGLAMVFGIVKQHHGWIRVHSQPGQGTTFQVLLPALPATIPESIATVSSPRPGVCTETILLVEDDEGVRMAARTVLEKNGYRVVAAANGFEAINLWHKYGADVALLITDLVMPGGLTGRQLARELHEKQPGLKVIYCSGYSLGIADKEFQVSHGETFLQKPFTSEQLLEITRRFLDSRP